MARDGQSILMIAPQPCFEPRGAPFCVLQHIKALTQIGYQVDLVTYPIGCTVTLPNLRIYRAPVLPFVRSVKPGFSWTKFPLDLLVFLTALWRLCVGRYRYLHTHEEGALMGMMLAPWFRCKHLYYMHCDLSQLVGRSPLAVQLLRFLQTRMLRSADAVITFYPELATYVRSLALGKSVYLILPPALDEGLPAPSEAEVADFRKQWELEEGQVVLYTGTLERYQGLDLLLQSVLLVHPSCPTLRYLVVGGTVSQVAELQALARKLDVQHLVRFVGQRPLEEMPIFMALADILVSPRCQGTHTPLKLYTYLRSGKPILATAVLSHTQILQPEVAQLVPPTSVGLAEGTLALLQNPLQAQALALRAQELAQQRYSWAAFLEENRRVYKDFAA